MKPRCIICINVLCGVIMLCCLAACSQGLDLAKSATHEDYTGEWTGAWSWNDIDKSSVQIISNIIVLEHFPIIGVDTDEIQTLSTTGVVEYLDEWSRRAPCILVLLQDPNVGFPIYISEDKNQLLYTISEHMRQRIIFERHVDGAGSAPDN